MVRPQILVSLALVLLHLGIYSIAANAFGNKSSVTLDLQNPDRAIDSILEPYMIAMRKRLQRLWLPNEITQELKTRVYFEVGQNGSIGTATVVKTSGDRGFDDTVLMAIHESAPYPRVPLRIMKVEAVFDSKFLTPLELAQKRAKRASKEQFLRQELNTAPDTYVAQGEANRYENDGYSGGREVGYNNSPRSQSLPAKLHAESEQQSDNVVESATVPVVENQWQRPITAANFRQLDVDQINAYKQWFQSWLRTPSSELFAFLNLGPSKGKIALPKK